MNLHRRLTYIVFSVFLFACKGYQVSWTQYLEKEILYYQLEKGASILDFSPEQRSIPALIATQQDSLHFYLGYGARSKYGPRQSTKAPQDFFTQISRTFPNHNTVQFSIVAQIGDSLLLPASSMDYVLCRDYLHQFNSVEQIVGEWYRVLQPNGKLFLKGLFSETIIYPNSTPGKNLGGIIEYIQRCGFRLIESIPIRYSPRMQNRTGDQMKLLSFVKQ